MLISLAVAALAAFAGPAFSLPSSPKPELSVKLTRLGNTLVQAVLTNNANRELKLLTLNTILDQGPVRRVDIAKNNKKVDFKGIYKLLRTSGLTEDAFTTVAPGATLTTEINVADTADLSSGGGYVISSHGVFSVADETGTAIGGTVQYRSNELKLEVDGAEAAAVPLAFNPHVKRTQLQSSSCSGDRVQIMQTALSNCQTLANAAAQAASSGDAAKFQEFYMTSSAQSRQTVASRFQSVARECSSAQSGATRYYCQDPYGQCQSNYIAYTYPTRNEVVNCPYFYRIPPVGSSCRQQDQGYTVLHEMTHAQGVVSPYCQDHAYGYDAIRRLSAGQAIQNADTYSLYSLAIKHRC
ncbi:hypothetical protein FQN57_002979 [Myotisia sp. PD_48]|nr:hypothetical protein FQN57_002979 [Myotisia sp. PD_48]